MEYAEPVLVYDRIDANRRNTFLLLLMLVALLAGATIVVGILLGLPYPYAPLLIIPVLIIALVSYYSSSRVTLAISQARQVTKAQEPGLFRIVENLCIGAGLPMPKVYVIEDSSPNAFATGRDPDHASVAVTSGLLQKLDKLEVEAVIAHELSHIGNYDIRLMTIVVVLVGLATLPSDLAQRLRVSIYGGGRRSSNRHRWKLLAVPITIPFIVFAPIAARLIRSAISRQREFLADASGALLCRNPGALARALAKISADPDPLEVASKATAHLYINDPLREHQSSLNSLFDTHPPMEERLAALAAMGSGVSPSVLREAGEAGAKFSSTGTAAAVANIADLETERLTGEATASAELTAPEKVERASGGFRLTGEGTTLAGGFRLTGEGTTLYAKPDTASAALRQLAGGALITVLQRQGDFLRVLTAGDRFGYIPSSASMTPAEMPTAATSASPQAADPEAEAPAELPTAAVSAVLPQAPDPERENLGQPDLPQPIGLSENRRRHANFLDSLLDQLGVTKWMPWAQNEAWRLFASEVGGEFIPSRDSGLGPFSWKSGTDEVAAKVDHWIVRLDTYNKSTGNYNDTTEYTRMRAYCSPRFRFEVCREGLGSMIGKLLGMQDIKVGYPEFDYDFIIKGDDESKVRALFANRTVRQLIQAQQFIHLQTKGADLYFEERGVINDVGRLISLHRLFAETLRQLRKIGAIH